MAPWRHMATYSLVNFGSNDRFVAWGHRAIIRTNVDWSLMRSSDICRRAISNEIPQPSINIISLKIKSWRTCVETMTSVLLFLFVVMTQTISRSQGSMNSYDITPASANYVARIKSNFIQIIKIKLLLEWIIAGWLHYTKHIMGLP